MSDRRKRVEPLPNEFDSYEEASHFWETHDTADYLDSFETITVESQLKRRRYEVEIDENLMKTLADRAHERGIRVNQLIGEMLREKVRSAA